jgi:alkanesulfonate monooxygenase SsuD/methylene tetrahydromethanopterin reductase-like flavin-dependent oxidoreductase (luciferase family)
MTATPPRTLATVTGAGGHPGTIELGARYAEAVFTALSTLDAAREYTDRIRARAAQLGRPAGLPLIFSSFHATFGATEKEARRLVRERQDAIDFEAGRALVAAQDTGHWSVAGAPEQLADAVEERFRAGVLDMLSLGGLDDPRQHDFVVNGLLHELRRRGIVKDDYLGPTFRENLGLPRPGAPH